MKRNLLLALGAVGLAATAVATSPLGTDYSALPPQPSTIAESLSSAKTTLGAAVKTAQTAVGGLASEVRMQDGTFIIDVYGREKSQTVTVSMADGKIVSTEDITWLPGDEVVTDWTTTASGLQYAEVVVGTGATPKDSTATVTCHYSGWLVDGTKFDSSVDRGAPIDFPLNRVIPGWTEGVGSMKVGGKRKLIIPASLGYGARGAGAAVPPNATLVFDVELIALP